MKHLFLFVIAAALLGCEQRNSEDVANVLRLTNLARTVGVHCGPYPSIELFAQAKQYPAGNSTLIIDSRLAKSARNHANHMAKTGEYEHQTLEKIEADGGDSENIGYAGPDLQTASDGTVTVLEIDTPKRLVDGWLESNGHCHNLMQPQWDRIGIGVAYASNGRVYGVQVFGR